MEKVSEEEEAKDVKRQLTVDELLEEANSFGPFQWILWIVIFGMMMITYFPVLAFAFAAGNSKWKCAPGSEVCTFNYTVGSSHDDWKLRCGENWTRYILLC